MAILWRRRRRTTGSGLSACFPVLASSALPTAWVGKAASESAAYSQLAT